MSIRRKYAVVAAFAAMTMLVAACGGSEDGGNGGGGGATGLTGTVVVSGSSTVQPISSLVAELFAGENPDVQISVDGPGTGDGFELFCNGETDINDASRPIKDEEMAACEAAGVNYVELKVGLDGVTVLTSAANGAVSCLTTADLYALLGAESEGFTSWSDANALAAQVGGTGDFPDAPLAVTAPGEESGTYDAFIELAGFEDFGVANGLSEDDAAVLRPDYQASADDNVIIQGIEGSDTSLGFVGFAFAENAGDLVKEIAVDAGGGCVAPSIETIADGSYPLSRSLYIYVNTDAAVANPALAAYVDLYVSADGLAAASAAGYVELPEAEVSATQSAWAAVA
ncbi:MAG: substrate-binding domain-containing protein [Actinomycetota bacterium]